MANTLVGWLLDFLSQSRPMVIALLCVALAIVLFRPRVKPEGPGGEGPHASSSCSPHARAAGHRPAVVVSTEGILLHFREGKPRVIPEAIRPLHALAAAADVYLITQLPEDSDTLEQETVDAFREAEFFCEGRCDVRKALFCLTEDGRAAMTRQILPTTHIDNSVKVLQYIAPHVAGAVCVSPDRPIIPCAKGSILSVATLSEYMQLS
ncbi:hypothetical protein AB1Y20_019910 [Prymnesium parvum]|uniref:Uncharacterized protein n=1 Tax=Prymnesium parvum TaxID=97485 RepID=A0AB34JVC8_PRYPA